MSRVIKARQVTITTETPVLSPEEPQASPSSVRAREPKKVAIDIQARAAMLNQIKREANLLFRESQRIVEQRMAELAAKEDSVEEELEIARRLGREEGYDDGYREGFDKGREEALREFETLLASAQAALDEARRSQWQLQERAEQDLVKLAVAVAEKITGQALRTDESVILSILEGMLAKAEGSVTARVRLPREIHVRLGEECRSLAASLPGSCTFEFHPDDTLGVGDVIIETDWGLIDGRIQSRWQRIIQGLDLLEQGDDA